MYGAYAATLLDIITLISNIFAFKKYQKENKV